MKRLDKSLKKMSFNDEDISEPSEELKKGKSSKLGEKIGRWTDRKLLILYLL